MKRVVAPVLVVLIVLVVSGITFAVGRKVATDQYRGSDFCQDWITNALRDAKLEASAFKDADMNYNTEFTVFLEAISSGVYYEGRNSYYVTAHAPPAASARPAPYKICTLDFTGSAEWNKYRPARPTRIP